MSAAKYVGSPLDRKITRSLSSPKAVERNHSRAVLLVDVPAAAEPFDGPLHPALVVQRALGLPDVEMDAEALEASLDPGPDPFRRPAADDVRRSVGPGSPRPAAQTSSGHGAREVARRSRRGSRPRGPARPRRIATTEAPSFRTCAPEVVEVVLARDPLAAGLEDAAQQVADERPAGVADRERTGRVGRHELAR